MLKYRVYFKNNKERRSFNLVAFIMKFKLIFLHFMFRENIFRNVSTEFKTFIFNSLAIS